MAKKIELQAKDIYLELWNRAEKIAFKKIIGFCWIIFTMKLFAKKYKKN